ncbi:Fc.00g068640.m01.CDS01 [Cosmosporella sp. VM-42]
MSSKKRSRPAVEELNRAECPFTIVYPAPQSRPDQDRSKNKKRKREIPEEDKKPQIQMSPFTPTGHFKTHDTLDLHYGVEPRKRWLDMTRYNSFVLNGTKYYSEGFVFVANESTIERQKSAQALGNPGPIKKKDDDWVARILEIRAADEHHVYARVYWMYWPDELPQGTVDGKKTIQGRQPYHGQNELIASNHMDVINVVSVTMPATVNQWIETEDDVQDALYWRQAYDTRNGQLSSVDLLCKCETPANPDKTLIGCTNNECNKWMHDDCLCHDVLMRVYDQLGTDKPHRKEHLGVKTEKGADRAARPLSPTDTGKETQPTIDVRSGEAQDNVLVRKVDETTPQPTGTPSRVPPTPSADTIPKSSAAKRGRKKKPMDQKPYEGLFKATLRMDGEGPTKWEIEDLRENVPGGDKTWIENAQCLLCGVTIS